MKFKIPSLFLKKEVCFKSETEGWPDNTSCALCKISNCACNINTCPCGKKSKDCLWPSDFCPCPICLKKSSKCNCTIKIKKDETTKCQ